MLVMLQFFVFCFFSWYLVLTRLIACRVTFPHAQVFNVLLYPRASRRAASSQLNDTDDY